MLLLQDKNKLTKLEVDLYKGYEKFICNIFDISCKTDSGIDPFTSEYLGKNSVRPDSKYYNSLLEVTSYFWASKGGRGTLLEKALAILAGDNATSGIYLSKFLDELIELNKTMLGNVSTSLKTKFDLINHVSGSLIILEIKNRVDSGGTAGRNEALTKFFSLCDHIRKDTILFIDEKTKKEHTLLELLKKLGIKNIELLMGLFYNIHGSGATIKDDQSSGFYSQSKKLMKNYGLKNPDVILEPINLKINFDKDEVEIVIQTIYGDDVTKRFTKSSTPMVAIFRKVFLKSWDDIWLSLNAGIRQRDILLKHKTNHILMIQDLYQNDPNFKSHVDKFREDSENLNLLKNIVNKIQVEGGGGAITSYPRPRYCRLFVFLFEVYTLKAPSFNVLQGDAYAEIKKLTQKSKEKNKYQLIVTSPPYYKHRNYGNKNKEIGQEQSDEDYLNSLIDVFEQCKKLLTEDGSLFIVIGDTKKDHAKLMIPHRLAVRLTDIGYTFQEDIIWHKKNAISTGSKSRLSQSYEFVLFLSKNKAPYLDMDSIRVPGNEVTAGSTPVPLKHQLQFKSMGKNLRAIKKIMVVIHNAKPSTPFDELPTTDEISWAHGYDPDKHCPTCYRKFKRHATRKRIGGHKHYPIFAVCNPKGKNPGNVWDISTKAHHGNEHFAMFPEDLIAKIVKFATKKNDCVFDPFVGRGTAGIVSACLKRNFTGIDLYATNVKNAKRNIRDAIELKLPDKVLNQIISPATLNDFL